MGQSFFQDNIPTLSVASTTSVQIAATNMGQPTRITIGGQQYALSSTLTLNTGTTGANGLDTGTLGASQTYFVYAVIQASTFAVALVASLNTPSSGPLMPPGYGTAYKLVGSFYTNGSSQIAGTSLEVSGGLVPIVVPGVSAGLVSASGVSGNTTGNAIASGYVGEVKTFTAVTIAAVTSGWTANATALTTLSAGVWMLLGVIQPGTGSGVAGMLAFLSTNSSNDNTGTITNVTTVPGSSTYGWLFPMATAVYVASGSTPIYGKALSLGASSTATISGYAVRIA